MLLTWRHVAGLALVVGILCGGLGCSPGFLGMLLMDDKVPPPCKLSAKDKEVTVAVVCNFANPVTRTELMPCDYELSERTTAALRKRFEENKEKIKLIPPSKLRAFQNKQTGVVAAQEVGKHFKADYVVSLEINSLELYERNSNNLLYRGNADINVAVHDLGPNGGEGFKYEKAYRTEHPRDYPIPATDSNVIQFRTLFLNRVANDVSKLFSAFPADERHRMD